MEIDDVTMHDGTTNADAEPISAEAPKMRSDVLFMMLEMIKKSTYNSQLSGADQIAL